jgi:hypothetical protein
MSSRSGFLRLAALLASACSGNFRGTDAGSDATVSDGAGADVDAACEPGASACIDVASAMCQRILQCCMQTSCGTPWFKTNTSDCVSHGVYDPYGPWDAGNCDSGAYATKSVCNDATKNLCISATASWTCYDALNGFSPPPDCAAFWTQF